MTFDLLHFRQDRIRAPIPPWPYREHALPLCWTCLTPIPEERRFPCDYLLGDREQYIRPISAFGFCERCRPRDGAGFFLGDHMETNSEGDLYTCCPILGAHGPITVLWTRAPRYRRRAYGDKVRNWFLSMSAECACGAPGTQVQHVIPRYWFRLNQIPEEKADFSENLLLICPGCNQRWYNYSVFAADAPKYWADRAGARAILDERLRDALMAARSYGLKILAPPEWGDTDFFGLPAQPVLGAPSDPGATEFCVVAYADVYWRLRTHGTGMAHGSAWRGGTLRGQGNPFLVLVE